MKMLKICHNYTLHHLMIYSWQRMSVHTPHLCTQITKPVKIVAPYQVDYFFSHTWSQKLMHVIFICSSWYRKQLQNISSNRIHTMYLKWSNHTHKLYDVLYHTIYWPKNMWHKLEGKYLSQGFSIKVNGLV